MWPNERICLKVQNHSWIGHVTLHDDAYNIERKVMTATRYKQLLAELVKKGVEVQLCGATATVHNLGNADLFADVKVNTNAMARISELAQVRFAQITE